MPRRCRWSGASKTGSSRQLQDLPAATRRLLLLAALEPVGDAELLWRAASLLELGPEDAVPAVQAGLVTFGDRVHFVIR